MDCVDKNGLQIGQCENCGRVGSVVCNGFGIFCTVCWSIEKEKTFGCKESRGI